MFKDLLEVPHYRDIREAISEIDAVEDWSISEDMIDQIFVATIKHMNTTSGEESFRRAANKKVRNNLSERICKNAENLARDLRALLTNQTLNIELLNSFSDVSKERNESELFPVSDAVTPNSIDVYEFQTSENYLPGIEEIFRQIIILRTLSEAAQRTNKNGFNLTTNSKTGIPEYSETINLILKQLPSTDFDDRAIEKTERASIISEIIQALEMSNISTQSIAKNIS